MFPRFFRPRTRVTTSRRSTHLLQLLPAKGNSTGNYFPQLNWVPGSSIDENIRKCEINFWASAVGSKLAAGVKVGISAYSTNVKNNN